MANNPFEEAQKPTSPETVPSPGGAVNGAPKYRLDFRNLKRQVVEIPIEDEIYYLKEATAAQGVRFRNLLASTMTFNKDGTPGKLKDPAEVEISLVAMTLFEKKQHKNGNIEYINVTPGKIKEWPHYVLTEIYRLSMEISKLEPGETEETILKRMDADRKKLEDLRKARKGGDDAADGDEPGNLPGDTTDTST
jgi:hypothetical protein